MTLFIAILIIRTWPFSFGTSFSWCCLASSSFSLCTFFSLPAVSGGQKLYLLHLQADLIDPQQSFWCSTSCSRFLGQIFSSEECWSSNLTMVIRRLLCSWRTSGPTTGRVSKTLVIRDSSTQRSLFVFGFISDGSAGGKQLGADVPLRQSLLPSKHEEFSPIISEKISSSASGMVRNRGRSSRNLLPGIRSKLRIQVRHRERAHFKGRWHPLWRRYAEVADLNEAHTAYPGWSFLWRWKQLLFCSIRSPACWRLTSLSFFLSLLLFWTTADVWGKIQRKENYCTCVLVASVCSLEAYLTICLFLNLIQAERRKNRKCVLFGSIFDFVSLSECSLIAYVLP